MARMVLEADLKVFPLFDITFLGNPLLEVKCLKLLINVQADRSGTRSRYTTLDTQHVYRQIHTLLTVAMLVALMYKGLAKLTPVKVNGGSCLTRNTGNAGGGGPRQGNASIRRQITHLCITHQTNCRPLMIQYFDLISTSVSLTPLCLMRS